MTVILLDHTQNPEKAIGLAGRLCYYPGDSRELSSRDDFDYNNMVFKLRKMGHMTPFEQASFNFGIDGISRACSHQLVRHRIASFNQQSQRYVAYNELNVEDFVVPKPILEGSEDAFSYYMSCLDEFVAMYEEMTNILVLDGMEVKQAAENARYLLPNAMKTNLIMSMNARELFHFFEVRCCRRAQEEINELAWQMLGILQEKFPVIFGECGPNCLTSKCKEGKMSCGQPYQKGLF